MKYFALVACASVFFLSCTHDVEDNPPDPPVVVEFSIDEPTPDSIYYLNDTVHIHGSLRFDNGLHGWMVELYNISTDSIMYTEEVHDHANELEFSTWWVNDVVDHSDMELTIGAITDHDGGVEEKVVHFHCMPM